MTATATITAWADGWGVWLAAVPDTGDPEADADAARRRIIDELTEREGPNFSPQSIEVEVHETARRLDGTPVTIYRERTN